ncbi:uncharacterized protein OGAPODRAFT_92689 [Ogataea polymorpha]|uniref:uncharacterized protein n=1 Tax=Ogataea polymorpha TaxID=460523 RepID=UPI0007F3D274|nr:uncharacterized protein OGAPODRAFT_92689 [Ogataea polymorpha]OBA17408.1 hypothetical protein OGAPODRAFT_92689 [Ogataea polymorpha]
MSSDLAQVKHLLNRLFLGLNDEYSENEKLLSQVKDFCDKNDLNYQKLIAKQSHGTPPRLSQEDSEIYYLEKQKRALLSRLQKEEYFSSKFEAILEKHRQLVTLLKDNVQSKAVFDAEYSKVYKTLVDQKLADYDSNIAFLNQQIDKARKDYQKTVEKLRTDGEALNKELG